MSRLRSDIWCAAFMRRHNDLGHFCTLARKGDPIAGQVFIELDHLDGTVSLYSPAPTMATGEPSADHVFQRRYDRVEPEKVRDRLNQEARFDPDFWVISLEMRSGDLGLLVVA